MSQPEPADLPETKLLEASSPTNIPATSSALVYQGEVIHERGEMLSLTDMWTAARRKHVGDGGDAADFETRRPDDWKKDAAHRAFLDQVAKNLNARPEGIWTGKRGAGGGTWAHWQVGLAYAKYLSPDFHMWCNTVVKSHMEGQIGMAPVVVPLVTSNVRAVAADFRALFGLAKLVGLDRNQCALRANRATLEVHGVDILAKLGQPLLQAPDQEVLLRATDVGRELGGLNAKAANLLLTKHGFQNCLRDLNDDIHYEPTDLGRPHSRMMDVDTRNRGTSKLQLLWRTTVIEPLKAAMAKVEDAA